MIKPGTYLWFWRDFDLPGYEGLGTSAIVKMLYPIHRAEFFGDMAWHLKPSVILLEENTVFYDYELSQPPISMLTVRRRR